MINKKRKKFYEAILFSEKLIELYKTTKDNFLLSLADAYINLANIYTELAKYEKAVGLLYNAQAIFEELKNETGLSYCYNNLANFQKELGQNTEAFKNAKKSLVIKQKNKDFLGEAISKQLIGELYLNLHQAKIALSYIEQSEVFFKTQSLDDRLNNIYHLKARIFIELKDTLNALKYYNLAILGAKNLNLQKMANILQKEKNKSFFITTIR